jgi:hypothetical protein
MDFKQHKTDITSMNSIIKNGPGWALLLTSCSFKKIACYISKHSGDKFHGGKTRNVLTVAIGAFY